MLRIGMDDCRPIDVGLDTGSYHQPSRSSRFLLLACFREGSMRSHRNGRSWHAAGSFLFFFSFLFYFPLFTCFSCFHGTSHRQKWISRLIISGRLDGSTSARRSQA
ncbi:hypothetical protein VTH06DRAFT_5945 [Thermothelomyces fergusii]